MKYYAQSVLAKGSFSEVLLAKDEEGKLIAVKKISKKSETHSSEWISNSVKNETKISQMFIERNNIIQFKEAFENEQNYFLVFEYLEGINLLEFLKKSSTMDEDKIFSIFVQLVSALSLLHEKKVIHHDLKGENIMINEKTLKVTLLDFGLSEITKNGITYFNNGSLPYMCPDKIASHLNWISDTKKDFDGFKSDVWSLGIILYTMTFLEFPWSLDSKKKDFFKNKQHPFPDLKNDQRKISPKLKDLLFHMIHPHASYRFTIKDVLHHPWMRNTKLSFLQFREKSIVNNKYYRKFDDITVLYCFEIFACLYVMIIDLKPKKFIMLKITENVGKKENQENFKETNVLKRLKTK